MALLNVHCDVRRDHYVVVAEVEHLASAAAGEADGEDLHRFGLLYRLQNVPGVAGGGDGEEDVAGLSERLDLAAEDTVVAEVVAARGQDRGICGQGDGAHGGTVRDQPHHELCYQVLGIGGGASVACDHQLAAREHGVGGQLGDGRDGVGDVQIGKRSPAW